MARIFNTDWNIFSNAEKTISDRFTEYEVKRIHEIAIELNEIMKAAIVREDSLRK
jgi:hypothetical protein